MSAVPDTDTAATYTPTRHRLSVAVLELLEREGLLPPDIRVELIEGELFDMAPIGPLHNANVTDLTRLFVLSFGDDVIVQCRGSIKLSDYSAPQPDVAVLKRREEGYRKALAGPADILLLVEVADSTARFDRNIKAQLYARHGVMEFWMIDLNLQVLEIYREPSARGYRTKLERMAGDVVSPLAAPNVTFEVATLIGA